MIFYFSGTGNSKWVAEQLAMLTGDEAKSITSVTKNDGPSAIFCAGKEERLGLVFPIYAWGAPKIVNEFIKSMQIKPEVYMYAVCTCGDEAGRAMQKLRAHFPWKAAWSISMPNNYIPMSDVDSPELEKAKLLKARERIPEIVEKIAARACVNEVNKGSSAWVKSGIVNPLFNVFARSTKPFIVDDTCIGCGLCEHNCPCGAIRLVDGKPTWMKKTCLQCMACIQRCPQRAIQYGKATRTRGRYSFTED